MSIKIHKKDNIEEKFNKVNFDNTITAYIFLGYFGAIVDLLFLLFGIL